MACYRFELERKYLKVETGINTPFGKFLGLTIVN